ncbi:MAG: GNAT family N-acetyltransferase [Candidatus Woesearchaeota archaeon]
MSRNDHNDCLRHLGIIVRQCRKEDHDFVYRLALQIKPYVEKLTRWDRKYFDDDFKRTYKSGAILLRGKRRIGMFQLKHNFTNIYIARIYLSPAYHGQGIGKALMQYFETVAAERHKRKIHLHVWKGNPAIRFYRKLGYRTIEDKNNKILMEKRI